MVVVWGRCVMAVRLDPLQTIVDVNWGSSNAITHVAIPMYLSFAKGTSISYESSAGEGDTYYGPEYVHWQQGCMETFSYRVYMGTSAIGWNGTTWAGLGLIGKVSGSTRLVKALGFEDGLKTRTLPADQIFQPAALNGSSVDIINENPNLAHRFQPRPKVAVGTVPVYLSPTFYYPLGSGGLNAEMYSRQSTGVKKYLRQHALGYEVEGNPVVPPQFKTPVIGPGAMGFEGTDTENLITGITVTYDGRPCTLASVLTEDSSTSVTPSVEGGYPRSASLLYEVPPP